MPLFGISINISKEVAMPLDNDQLKGIFQEFDANGDKRLSMDELRAAFAYLGACFPSWRALCGLNYADANNDGYIDEDELHKLVDFASKFGYTVK